MKGMNIKKYLFIIAVCAVIALIAYSSGTNKSSTNAAYRTEVNGSDSARVAKWKINSLDKNGQAMSLSADVQNIESGSGNWFLEIQNLSEVVAKYGSNSKIKLKLGSEIFGLNDYFHTGNHNWNFIKKGGSYQVNPIKFVVTLYDCPLNQILSYTTSGGLTYSIEDYLKLDEAVKLTCTEKVDVPSTVTKAVAFDTSLSTIQLVYEDGYMIQEFELGTLLAAFSNFGMDSNNKKCIRIEWSISGSAGGTNETTKQFEIYNADGTVKETVDLFDYQKYMSSLKGEPSYNILRDGEYLTVRHSKLTSSDKTWLTASGTAFEKKTYTMYESFNAANAEYLKTLGYLECGLTASIIFDLKVEQVD